MICGSQAVDAAQALLRLRCGCCYSGDTPTSPCTSIHSSFRTSSARRHFEIFRHEPLPADAPRTGDAPRTKQRANALHVDA